MQSTTKYAPNGLEHVVRARVDSELYAFVLEEARRRKLSLSDVLRHALLDRYRPERLAPPVVAPAHK